MKEQQKRLSGEILLLGFTALFLCALAALWIWDQRAPSAPAEEGRMVPAEEGRSVPEEAELQLSAVNLNTADRDALAALPGIGPALAERIVQYRQENGPFTAREELMNVPGIGEKKYSALEDRIEVDEGEDS